jgi:hypothetical protein
MSTQNHEVWANSTTPLFLTNPTSNLQTTSVTLAGSPPLVLSNSGGTLTENGVLSPPTAQWSTLPATSNKVYMDTSNILSNIGGNLYFNGNLLARAGDISNVADWSLYPQLCNINGNGKSIISNSGLTSTGLISTTSNIQTPSISNSGALSVSASTLSNTATTITDTADRGIDVGGNATYSITAQNGAKGVVEPDCELGVQQRK